MHSPEAVKEPFKAQQMEPMPVSFSGLLCFRLPESHRPLGGERSRGEQMELGTSIPTLCTEQER